MLLAASGFAVAPALVLARGDDPPEPPEAHPVVTGLGWRRRRGVACSAPFRCCPACLALRVHWERMGGWGQTFS